MFAYSLWNLHSGIFSSTISCTNGQVSCLEHRPCSQCEHTGRHSFFSATAGAGEAAIKPEASTRFKLIDNQSEQTVYITHNYNQHSQYIVQTAIQNL